MSKIQFAQSFFPSSVTPGSGWAQKLIDQQAQPVSPVERSTVRGPLLPPQRSLLWAENRKGRFGAPIEQPGKR